MSSHDDDPKANRITHQAFKPGSDKPVKVGGPHRPSDSLHYSRVCDPGETLCPRFSAWAGDNYIESENDLEKLVGICTALVCPGSEEDVVVFDDDASWCKVMCVITAEGKVVWIRRV